MVDLHIFYVGHFVHDGNFIAKVDAEPSTRLYYPHPTKRLSLSYVSEIASSICPNESKRESWDLSFKDGYLVINAINPPEVYDLIRRLVDEAHCDVADGVFRLIPRAELDD